MRFLRVITYYPSEVDSRGNQQKRGEEEGNGRQRADRAYVRVRPRILVARQTPLTISPQLKCHVTGLNCKNDPKEELNRSNLSRHRP